jgi:hypothetical protein
MNISGTVVFVELSGGFWGIESDDARQWLPTDMPKALKKKGLKVKIKAKEAEDYMSIYMWGTPIDIESYQVVA